MNKDMMNKAYEHCLNHGHRFTEPREHVLNILLDAEKPLGAYDILQRLSQKLNKPKPPTVYRAIQFWHQEGFIHCIDSLKSYVACKGGHHIGQTQFLICNQCEFVKELDYEMDLNDTSQAAKQIDFSIQNVTIEVKGICHDCADNTTQQ